MLKTLAKIALISIMAARLIGFGACAQVSKASLDPENPIVIDCWHYYNGTQKINFDRLVDTFNQTTGAAQGIEVRAESKGNVAELASAVQAAAAAGPASVPDIFATYPGTAYELASEGRLVDLSRYLRNDDLDQFKPEFLNEGRFIDGSALYILPLAKSTEVIAVNMTAWKKFAAENPRHADPAAALETWESTAQAAEAYRHWSNGEALIGFDSLANFLLVGSSQLGTDLMTYKDGRGSLSFNRETMRRLWNIYYVNTVSGSFAHYGSYRADDLASGQLVAGILSTASGPWLPQSVLKDGNATPIELKVFRYPTFRDSERVIVQQGAGMAVFKTDLPSETVSAIFLGWLARPEQNVNFTIASSYLPVTHKALQSQLLRDSLTNLDRSKPDQAGTALCLETFITQMEDSRLYYPPAFSGSNTIREYIEKSLAQVASEARKSYINDLSTNSMNSNPQKLLARYVNDVAFESWYSAVIMESERLLNR